MKSLFKKELSYYLNNPVGYIIIVLFAVFANFLFVKDIFVVGSASMKPFFGLVPWLLLIFVPAIAMRSIAEEKRTNTIETLLTLPLSETQIVVAKFLALKVVMVLALLLTMGLPISLSFLTRLSIPEIIVGYIGVFLMGGFFISLSLFYSSLTKNQVVAFLASIVTLFFILVLGTDLTSNVFPKEILDFTTYLSPFYHLQNFVRGVIDVRSIFYFVSFTVIFLFLTIVNLEKRD